MMVEQLGPYQIVRELGHGGMGTVYEGVNRETGERAAVKLLAARFARQEDFRERFEAEVETLRKLNHPNIVRLFGFGQKDEHLFYAMELVAGNSLEQELGRGRRFDWREVTRIGIQTCHALRHAHDRGVVHRDIKPGNLLMTGDGQVKLSDFGIARLFGNARLTEIGSVVGTAEYMSPEQAEGRPVSPRTDLYSLGVVLYVLLARRPLFRAKSLPELLHKQRYEKPDRLGDYAPDVPNALEAIIAQLLEKDPERRVSNPALLARQLEAMERALSLKPPGEDAFAVGAEPGRAGSRGDSAPAPPPDGSNQPGDWQLRPTRAAEEPQPDLPATPAPADQRLASPPSEDDLPETKATAAFKGLREPEAAEAREPASHFTPVAEEELDRPEVKPERHALISLQTWALVAGLIAVALTVRYFLKQPSPVALMERIAARTADGTIDSKLEAKDDIEEFLSLRLDSRHPKYDELRQFQDKLREYQKEIELHDEERRFELRAKGLAEADNLSPIQEAYLEAIKYQRLDPGRGMSKLQALIDLYDHRTDTSGPDGKCLELARRRLKRLHEQLDEQTARQRALVQGRLDQADRLSRTEPERARAMYRAVVELYGGQPWAKKEVQRARDALAAEREEKQ